MQKMTFRKLKILTVICAPTIIAMLIFSLNKTTINKAHIYHDKLTNKYINYIGVNKQKPIIETEQVAEIEEKILLFPDTLIKRPSENKKVNDNLYEQKYKVVVGAFKVKNNAEHSIKILKEMGYDARFIKTNNEFHKVSIGGFDNKEDALILVEKTRMEGLSAWIER